MLREAARRCRERRSNYIKQLENKITVLETKQKALQTDNGSLLKQVHDLKKIIECNLTTSYNANSHNFNGHSNTNFSGINYFFYNFVFLFISKKILF